MKRMLLVGMLLIASILSSFSQGLGFNYQAMIRNAEGEAILNQQVVMRIGIVQGSVDGTVLYTETHATESNAYGLVNLVVGTGEIVSGVFADIDWATGPFFLKVELDAEANNNFVTLGTTQLLSVPFANYAFSGGSGSTSWVDAEESVSTNKKVGIGTSTPSSYLQIEATQSTKADEPIFEVKNANGKTVFAVYENQVKVFVDDTATNGGFTVKSRDAVDATKELFTVKPDETTIYVEESSSKATRGGFAVSGRTTTKEDTIDLLRITPSLAEFIVSEPDSRATRGGFAVSGRTTTKGVTEDLLSIMPSMTEFFVESIPEKATRGGFAVSGRTTTKESLELFNITPDFTRFYVDEESGKATRGGFAVSGRTTTKGIDDEIFKVTPSLTEVFVEEDAITKATRGGFAVSGRTTTKETGLYDIFTVQPERTEIYVKNDPAKAGIPGFSIFGLTEQFGAGELFSVTEAGTVVNNALAVAPKVTTGAVEGIAQTEAYGGGSVTDSSGSVIIEVGIIYNRMGALNLDMTFDDPSISGVVMGDPALADDFSGLLMQGLEAGVTYQVRAYAINADGATGYGSIVTFTTEAPYDISFDIMTSESVSISNATITITQDFYPYNSITNDEGDYNFGLAGGSYWVQVVAPGYFNDENYRMITGDDNFEIFMTEAPAQLTMNVTDDLGNPVEYAYIDFNDGMEGSAWAETDTTGVAKVYLEAGTWNYTIYETSSTQQFTASITMEDGVDQEIDIVLVSKPTFTVNITVFQEDGSTPAEGAEVTMMQSRKSNYKGDNAKYFDEMVITGADGVATFTNVPQGDFYDIWANWGMMYTGEIYGVIVDQDLDLTIELYMMVKKDK